MPRFRRERLRGQIGRQLQPRAQLRGPEKVPRELGHIVGEVIQRVVAGIKRPDDGIHGGHAGAGGLRNVVQVARERAGIRFVARAHIGQQADAGEVRAELIVNVLGDARPFLFHRVLLAQPFDAAAQSPQRRPPEDPNPAARAPGRYDRQEPVRLPEIGMYRQGHRGGPGTPHAFRAGGQHAKLAPPGWNAAVGRGARRSGVHPVGIHTGQLVAETNPLRRGQTGRGKLELHGALSGTQPANDMSGKPSPRP